MKKPIEPKEKGREKKGGRERKMLKFLPLLYFTTPPPPY
jgi:hypothetical protein